MINDKIVKKEFKNFTIPYKLFHYRINVEFVDNCGDDYFLARVYRGYSEATLKIVKEALSIKLIMHESLHLAYSISEHIGLPINLANEEFSAYISMDITEKILNKINKFL